jgi:two-component system sensor histidine kinase KdpD
MKYSPPGSPIRICGAVEGGMIAVTVADSGAGLTADELGQVGDRFFRGDRASATTTGSGLGLWIAKAFLHANGGSLDADSDGADRGSTLILRLPIPAQKAPLSGANLD